MKNSKKGLSKLSTIDAGFAEKTGVLQNLRKQFPKVIEEMIKLLVAANTDCENHLHEFAFAFNGITHLYGRRLNSPVVNFTHPDIKEHPHYIANQLDRREKLEKAVPLLTELTTDLRQLDLYHFKTFISFYKTPYDRTKYSEPSKLFFEIELATRVIAACQEAYSSTFKAPVKKRSRPRVPHVDAARELINLWERYTGEKVPISKTHKHQVATNPAQFIRLGISLIDPSATDANVVTAINNALSQ